MFRKMLEDDRRRAGWSVAPNEEKGPTQVAGPFALHD
jgi:hypothetical protein